MKVIIEKDEIIALIEKHLTSRKLEPVADKGYNIVAPDGIRYTLEEILDGIEVSI
jgi:hypothetical protein